MPPTPMPTKAPMPIPIPTKKLTQTSTPTTQKFTDVPPKGMLTRVEGATVIARLHEALQK